MHCQGSEGCWKRLQEVVHHRLLQGRHGLLHAVWGGPKALQRASRTYAFAHLAIKDRPVLCRMRSVECSLVMLGRCTGSHRASFRGAIEVRFLVHAPSALLPPALDACTKHNGALGMAVPCTKGGYGTSSDDVTKPIQASTRLTCHGSLFPCNPLVWLEEGRQRVPGLSNKLTLVSNMHTG